jgi:hypothetical protein
VALKKKLADMLTPNTDGYWDRVEDLVDSIEMTTNAVETDAFQITPIAAKPEREALQSTPSKPRNWSVYLRAPLSYFELFGATQ